MVEAGRGPGTSAQPGLRGTGGPRRAVLLVEDNEGDVRLLQEALRACASQVALHVARDGEQALRMLRGAPPSPPLRPDLVLLDLNLPGMSGFEVLADIREDPALPRLPVVVLTSSATPRDVARAYALQANSYHVKPSDFQELEALARHMEAYWFHHAVLPSRAGMLAAYEDADPRDRPSARQGTKPQPAAP